MTPIKKNCRINGMTQKMKAGALAIMVAGATCFTACSSNSSQEYELETKVELTKGVITTVQEVEADKFKITDETVVDQKEDSRLIAVYMDETRDTFTLDEARLVETESARGSGMNRAFMGGVMGYYLGRSLSSPLNSASYSSTQAYQKSNTQSANTVKSTARRTTVSKPMNSTKGYGGGRSTRSFGG